MAPKAATKREKREAGEKKQGRGVAKKESGEPPKAPKSRRRPEGPSSSLAETRGSAEDGRITGLLHKKPSRIGVVFPPEIPSEYYAGRLPLPATVKPVKLEPAESPVRREKPTEVVDATPAAAYSDSRAACLHVAQRLVADERSSLHSLSPTSKSLLVHFFDFMAPKAAGEKKTSKRKAEDVPDEATTVLMGIGHDAAALKRMREGWSGWGPDRYHWGVNLMDRELDAGKRSGRTS
jgi:hypothetical protein